MRGAQDQELPSQLQCPPQRHTRRLLPQQRSLEGPPLTTVELQPNVVMVQLLPSLLPILRLMGDLRPDLPLGLGQKWIPAHPRASFVRTA